MKKEKDYTKDIEIMEDEDYGADRERRFRNAMTVIFISAVAIGLAAIFLFNTRPVGEVETEHTVPVITSHVSPITDFDTEYGGEAEEEHNGFTANLRKYKTEDGNIAVLTVENRTGKACTVTVTGHYIDENGEELATERSTFKGMADAYRHTFVFEPGTEFADFTYEVSSRFFEGVPYAAALSFGELGEAFYKEQDGKAEVCLELPEITNGNSKAVDLELRLLIFDGRGKLIVNEFREMKTIASGETRQDTAVLRKTDLVFSDIAEADVPQELSECTVLYTVITAEKAK